MPTLQYTYNGDGQRVQTVESGVTKKQIWDEENILLETDGSGATQVVYTLEPAGYGNLVSQRRSSTTSLYLFDALGSTRRLVSIAGAVTDSYDYRAYGEISNSSGTTVNVFRWVGQLGYYFDLDRLAYYVRARHYSPKLARWISQDPIGFEGSKWNLYQYVNSQPASTVDPSGLGPVYDNCVASCMAAIGDSLETTKAAASCAILCAAVVCGKVNKNNCYVKMMKLIGKARRELAILICEAIFPD